MRRGLVLLLLIVLSFSLIACNRSQNKRDYVEFTESSITVEIYSSEPDWDSLYAVYDNEGKSNTIITLDIDQSELDYFRIKATFEWLFL